MGRDTDLIHWTLRARDLFGGAPKNQQFVSVDLTQNRVDVLDDAGGIVKTDTQKKQSFYVTLRWSAGSWKVLELENTA